MTDDKRSKVISLLDEMAKRGKSPVEQRKPARTVRVEGNQSVGLIGNGNQVTINVTHTTRPAKSAKPPLALDPGGKHISSAQAGLLANMVRDLHALNVHAQRVWGTFNRRYGLASFRELPPSRFSDAEVYLRKWLAKERAAVGNTDEERNRLLKAIHATKRQRGLADQMDDILQELTGGARLSVLAVADLKRVLTTIQSISPAT